MRGSFVNSNNILLECKLTRLFYDDTLRIIIAITVVLCPTSRTKANAYNCGAYPVISRHGLIVSVGSVNMK